MASTKTKKAADDKKLQAVEMPPPPSPEPPPMEEKVKEEVKDEGTVKDVQIDVEEGPKAKYASKSQVVEASPPNPPPMIKTLSSKPAVSVTTLAKKFENAAIL